MVRYIKKYVRFLMVGFCLSLSLGFFTPMAQAKHKHHQYKYIYYPGSQVYYSPGIHRYYYMDNGAWTYGVAPPPNIRLGKNVSVDLGGPVPYVYHPTVIQQYPVIIEH